MPKHRRLPYIYTDIAQLDAATVNWRKEGFLRDKFNSEDTWRKSSVERTERGTIFLYHGPEQSRAEDITSYDQFEALAKKREVGAADQPTNLLYLTISAGLGRKLQWMKEALPFLFPSPAKGGPGNALFKWDESDSFKGVNCRFGMRGIVQESHYDGKRNWIAMISGSKRYVIQPPAECPKLELFPQSHKNSRHASWEWSSKSKRAKRAKKPFCRAETTEMVLATGEVLYLPSFWFHFIVSLDTSMQCNSRDGVDTMGRHEIHKCGFGG
jgi:hypothetical protein